MSIELRLAGVIKQSVVDGPGWRFAIFAQGCRHNCPGCHNPTTHPFDGGYISNSDRLIAEIKKNPLLSGVTFTGGDPFEQAVQFAGLGREIHELGLNIITYTGYTIEYLMQNMEKIDGWRALIEESDYIIDGPFLLEKKTLCIPFRGSSNQRIIDPQRSLAENRAVETDFEDYSTLAFQRKGDADV